VTRYNGSRLLNIFRACTAGLGQRSAVEASRHRVASEARSPLRWGWLQRITVCLGLSLAIAALPALGFSATPAEILSAPERYDGHSVALDGIVTHLSQRVSQRANAYYTLDLQDPTGAIRVFSFGTSPCTDGMKARVEGTFHRVKRVGPYTFHNEVSATTIMCR
jgi:hypothetical protein